MILTSWDVQSKQIHSTDGICSPICSAEKRWTGMSPIIYAFDSKSSNSMKSKNPFSGCREVDVVRTLDTTIPDPSKNQGGNAVLETYCIAGNTIDRKITNGANGTGVLKEVSYTLNTIDKHAVIASIGHDERSSQLDPNVADPLTASDYKDPMRVAGTLSASDSKGKNGQDVNKFPIIESRIRRLTPLECERLQGLDDNWTNVPSYNKKGKLKPASDANRYKAIGNGMAVPCSDFVIRQIARWGNETGEVL